MGQRERENERERKGPAYGVIPTSKLRFHFGTSVTQSIKCRIPFLEANLQDLGKTILTVCYTVFYSWNETVNSNSLFLKAALAL